MAGLERLRLPGIRRRARPRRPRQNDRPLRRSTHRSHAGRRRRRSTNRLARPRLRSKWITRVAHAPMLTARNIRVRGIVQGVGFRPFVFRLAQANTLSGWVFNDEDGVEIHLEGPNQSLDAFVESLKTEAPQAAQISTIHVQSAEPSALHNFEIRHSERTSTPTTRIAPDLPVCADCLAELFNPTDPRFNYPYINCTNCGPRYSVILELPYDRANTTMKSWPLDDYCAGQYSNPSNRRFLAQPVARPQSGR